MTETQKQKKLSDAVQALSKPPVPEKVSRSLAGNKKIMQKLFCDDDTMKYHSFQNAYCNHLRFLISYTDGLVNSIIMNEHILEPLMHTNIQTGDLMGSQLLDLVQTQVLEINEVARTDSFDQIIRAIDYGDTVLFLEDCSEALLLNTKGFNIRSVSEPESEKILSGPREGFTETLMVNLGLLRRKLRTNDLKMKFCSIGDRAGTQLCVCYLDSLVNRSALRELYQRLSDIDMDAVLDSNYLTELTRDKPYSPFRTTGYTERPDVVAGKLLEGRIAVFVDGTPVVMTVPYLFIENFQSSEDYYLSFFYTSFTRLLRILGFIITVVLPGLYIVVVAYHQEMLPTSLLISIATERSSVPLPAALEAFVLLIVFDILKETGIRMPAGVGQALSIVGALVIGQAAVDAKLVASPMIIVVALTGITGLLVPKMNAPMILCRFFLLLFGSILGFFGLVMGIAVLLIHILRLTSLGIPQIGLNKKITKQGIKDIFLRFPWWDMTDRPYALSQNKRRMNLLEKTRNI